MGGQESKIATGGSLQGAIAPSISVVPEENLPSLNKPTTFKVTVPSSVVKPSDGSVTMRCNVNGTSKIIKIPEGLRQGDTFRFTESKPEIEKIFTSTLPSIPGMEIIQSKQIVWGSVSYSFYGGSFDQQAMGNMVGKLMGDAQTKVMEQVIAQRCNACLAMAFNVTNDSSGERGNQKLVIVTAHGTPCVVVPTTTVRAVAAVTATAPALY